MPQFDTLTYFSQIVWLVVTFFTFYYVLATKILPTVSLIFKVRNRIKGNKNITNKSLEKFNYEKVLINNLAQSKVLNQNISLKGKTWVTSQIDETNKQQLNSLNEKYLTTIGSIYLKKI